MHKIAAFGLLCFGLISHHQSNAQVYDYEYGKRKNHAGIQADFNQNLGTSVFSNNYSKGAFAPSYKLGVYAKRQLGNNLYFKGGFSLGTANFSYKLPNTYESTADSAFPIEIFQQRNISVPIIEPEIALGYLWNIKEKHQVDIRLSASVPIYLARYNNEYDTVYTTVTHPVNYQIKYGNVDGFQINNSGKQWGMVNANLYLGYKKIHFNDFHDRMSIGLTFGYTVVNENAGMAWSKYYDFTNWYERTTKSHKLTFATVGIRLEYDLF